MQPLDKALLAKELSELIQTLNAAKLAYFDLARCKQRLLELNDICLQLKLNHQLEKISATQPLIHSQEFIYDSAYREFCCGVFSDQSELKQILQQQQNTCWAVLYQSQLGWQIWLQQPNLALLISEFSTLNVVYKWLVDQQQHSHCFQPTVAEKTTTTRVETAPESSERIFQDQEVIQIESPNLSSQNTHTFNPYQHHSHAMQKRLPKTNFSNAASEHVNLAQNSSSLAKSRLLRQQEIDISQGLNFDLGVEPLHATEKSVEIKSTTSTLELEALAPPLTATLSEKIQAPTVELEIQTEPQIISVSVQSQPNTWVQPAVIAAPQATVIETSPEAKPQAAIIPIAAKAEIMPEPLPDFILDKICFQIHPLQFNHTHDKELFTLVSTALSLPHVDLLIHQHQAEHVLQQPIYIAEQVNQHGLFHQYVVLFGAQNELQAIRMCHLYSQMQQHKIMAVSRLNWTDLSQQLFDLNRLFNCYYAHAELVWNQQKYYPFIPKQLLHTQKFLQFEEIPANQLTPLVLLKERQKIRIIHGDKRLKLHADEQAYPYLLLDRQQGINWQLIQEVIQKMPQPISAISLYQAICMQLS